jgi:hypothetical protein
MAHKEFRETADLTLEESELERHKANLVQRVVESVAEVMTVEPPQDDIVTEESSLTTPAVNHTMMEQQQLLQQLADMRTAMATLQAQFATPQLVFQPYYHQQGGRGGRGRRSSNSGRGGRGAPRERTDSKYCWTHGAYAHDSAACNTKAVGHRDDATFANKQNGSLKLCPE